MHIFCIICHSNYIYLTYIQNDDYTEIGVRLGYTEIGVSKTRKTTETF